MLHVLKLKVEESLLGFKRMGPVQEHGGECGDLEDSVGVKVNGI